MIQASRPQPVRRFEPQSLLRHIPVVYAAPGTAADRRAETFTLDTCDPHELRVRLGRKARENPRQRHYERLAIYQPFHPAIIAHMVAETFAAAMGSAAIMMSVVIALMPSLAEGFGAPVQQICALAGLCAVASISAAVLWHVGAALGAKHPLHLAEFIVLDAGRHR